MYPVALVIRWLGQACFLLTTIGGSHILIDPPHPEVGYHIVAHSLPADMVFVSHEHPDHNFAEAASGTPALIAPLTKPGPTQSGVVDAAVGVVFRYTRLFAYHDNVHGVKRGPDTITVIETNGLRICHLGDLGQLALTPYQITAIGRVDVLMIPVGGFFTINGTQAAAIVQQLHPRVILPMHYATPALNSDLREKLATNLAFLAAMKGHAAVVSIHSRDLSLSPKTLPKTPTIYLLRYE